MLPASNKGVGMNMGFPDVCLTPAGPAPVPIPYPNMAMHAMAAPFCPTVFVTFMPALNMGSIVPMTLGDQPGVANPLFMQMGAFTMGNPTVLVTCLPGINLLCPTTGNAMNNPVGAVLVPSVTNVFYTDATLARGEQDPVDRVMTLEEIEEIWRSLARSGPAVRSELLPGGVGLISLRRFSGDVPSAVYHAVRQLTGEGMTSLIIDLQGNPGGEMNAFIQLAGDFLEPGSVVVTMTDVDGDDTVHRAGEPLPYPSHVVLLVDHGTASAAELFAGCLKAHGRAVVVGERTYGKGEAQALVASSGEGAVYGTVASFKLPDGSAVQGTGVEPDLSWPGPGTDVEAWREAAARRLPEALVEAVAHIAHSPRAAHAARGEAG